MKIGFTSLLTLVFIVLKLTKVISWSWLWVLSPAWIVIILSLTTHTVIFILVDLYKKGKLKEGGFLHGIMSEIHLQQLAKRGEK